MMRYLLWICTSLMLLPVLDAQPLRDWPINDFLKFTVNPAYTVESSSLSIGLNHARKWKDVNSSPTQSNLGVLIPFSGQSMGIGTQVFNESVGPFASTGAQVTYGYKFRLSKKTNDQLALGLGARFMHIRFDQEHFISADEGDELLYDIDGNRFVPPSLSVGFNYQSEEAQYGNPVQLKLSGSVSRFLPFEDRFNTVSFERVLQWYGLAGLNIAAGTHFRIEPSFLVSAVEKSTTNYGLRVKAEHLKFGWLMMQYTKSGFLVSQLGINIRLQNGDLLQLNGSNGWFFGTVSNQLGNSFSFGMTYQFASGD